MYIDEGAVVGLARRISQAGGSERTRVYHLTWWADRMLQWAMAHPLFKTQLFRFIDVFPACRDDADIARHIEEYFSGMDAPAALEIGMEAAEHLPFGHRIEASVARRNITRMASQFIAGASPADALPRLRELWRLGEATTVDLLGEKTVTLDEADRYTARVHELLDALAADAAQWPPDAHLERDPWGPVPRVSVSVKPTALAPSLSPTTPDEGLAQAEHRLRAICEHARHLGASVYLDMEHFDVKALTLELVRRVGTAFGDTLDLGAVLQAYLRDAHEDLTALIEWARASLSRPFPVRLVKGAYWDYETTVAAAHGWPSPVFADKRFTDANFERCTRLLLANAGVVRPAFGTHNLRSIAYALSGAEAHGLHDTAVEIQLLYGMAEPVHASLRRLGYRVRAYAPVGELVPGMAYLVRRLLENTANESFLRHRFAEGRDLDELLEPPGVPDEALEAPVSGEPGDGFRNEPLRELRRPGSADGLAAAVARASSSASFVVPAVIGGERLQTSAGIESRDPSDPDRIVCTSARCGPAEAALAVEVGQRTQPSWAAVGAQARAAVMRRAAALLRERRDELAALEVIEAGKPWTQADADVCEAIDFCEYYASRALLLAAGEPIEQAAGEANALRYRPRGVVAVIAPWNFPLAIPCGMTAAALVTGNAVVLKPAEQTPGVALRLVEVLHEAGVPSGALSLVPGLGEEVGRPLVEDDRVSMVAFTGSREVGLGIVAAAGRTGPGRRDVLRVVAEMGGKNAVIVDSDADLDVAVPAIVDSAFAYAGQKCSAASRVVAVGAVHDELIDRLVGAAALLPIGAASQRSTIVGPLIDPDALERVRGYQLLAASEGEVVLQREDLPGRGWFAGPTIVVVPDPSARVATEEIFGPVLAVLHAADLDEALAVANLPAYALTAGVFSRSPVHIARAAAELRAGNIYVNRGITGALVGRHPFGGYGLSGLGSKAGGPDYLKQFTDPWAVSENTIRQGFAPPEGPGAS